MKLFKIVKISQNQAGTNCGRLAGGLRGPSEFLRTKRSARVFSVGLRLSSFLSPRSSILGPQSSVLIPQFSVLNPWSSVLNPWSSVLSPQSSVLSSRSSVLGSRSSFLSPRSSLLGPKSCFVPKTLIFGANVAKNTKVQGWRIED